MCRTRRTARESDHVDLTERIIEQSKELLLGLYSMRLDLVFNEQAFELQYFEKFVLLWLSPCSHQTLDHPTIEAVSCLRFQCGRMHATSNQHPASALSQSAQTFSMYEASSVTVELRFGRIRVFNDNKLGIYQSTAVGSVYR